MSEVQPGRLKHSTRITFGLFMKIAGFPLTALSLMIPGVIGYGMILTLFAGPILLLSGVFQMLRGLREREAPDQQH